MDDAVTAASRIALVMGLPGLPVGDQERAVRPYDTERKARDLITPGCVCDLRGRAVVFAGFSSERAPAWSPTRRKQSTTTSPPRSSTTPAPAACRS